MITFKALAALLAYPEAELLAALPEIGTAMDREGLLPRRERAAVASFLAELGEGDIFELQERYVALFDRTRALSLHLFEHVHGESRDRGQAMVNLLQVYRDHGLELAANELPDYLPVFLEYLSELPLAEAKKNVAETSTSCANSATGCSRRAAATPRCSRPCSRCRERRGSTSRVGL